MPEIVHTPDLKLAACLITCGVKPRNPDHIARVLKGGRESWTFYFHADGVAGVSTTAIVEAIRAGQEAVEGLRDKIPDLPGARAALYNRESLLDIGHKNARRLVMAKLPGGGVLLADEKLSAEAKRQAASLAL